MNLLQDLAANLRKPDCDHQHLSFPDADVSTIINTLLRHRDEALEILNPSKPSIIGRERFLMERVAKLTHKDSWKKFDATPLRETRRGFYFEVQVTTSDGEATGRVARITIELDRVE